MVTDLAGLVDRLDGWPFIIFMKLFNGCSYGIEHGRFKLSPDLRPLADHGEQLRDWNQNLPAVFADAMINVWRDGGSATAGWLC